MTAFAKWAPGDRANFTGVVEFLALLEREKRTAHRSKQGQNCTTNFRSDLILFHPAAPLSAAPSFANPKSAAFLFGVAEADVLG